MEFLADISLYLSFVFKLNQHQNQHAIKSGDKINHENTLSIDGLVTVWYQVIIYTCEYRWYTWIHKIGEKVSPKT